MDFATAGNRLIGHLTARRRCRFCGESIVGEAAPTQSIYYRSICSLPVAMHLSVLCCSHGNAFRSGMPMGMAVVLPDHCQRALHNVKCKEAARASCAERAASRCTHWTPHGAQIHLRAHQPELAPWLLVSTSTTASTTLPRHLLHL